MPELSVTFKDEGTDASGVPIGPVVVDDLTAAKQDPNVGPVGMPYGYQPPWRDDRGWMTLPDAECLAAGLGVALRRS